jgi:hypothetical protein
VNIGVVCKGFKDLRSYLMPARRRLLVAIVALGASIAPASLDAQRSLAPFPPAERFDPLPLVLPPLHISGETRIRLRDVSPGAPMLPADLLLQGAEPPPSRSPERIRRAVVTLTALAASAMVLLLVAAWLFLRRRQS